MDNKVSENDNFFMWLMALACAILLVLFFVVTPNRKPVYDIHPLVYEALYNRMFRTCEFIHHSADVDCADVVNEAMQRHLETVRYCNGFTVGYDEKFADCLNRTGVME